jgi:tRNA A-37 threonylcarbamoyl transferase component Bud32
MHDLDDPRWERFHELKEQLESLAFSAHEGWLNDLKRAGEDPQIIAMLQSHLQAPEVIQRIKDRQLGGTATLLDASRHAQTAAPTLAGYVVVQQIGRGGQAVVFEAMDVDLKVPVAIKWITAPQFADPTERTRILNEAQLIARLDHANIVKILRSGECQGHPYLVLDYCANGSLAEWKKTKPGPVHPKEAAFLVRQLADAIHTAHRDHIIHRDLKPNNVLLTKDGSPKITDFGLAKHLDETSIAEMRPGWGTPGFWAPEQASGDANATGTHTDIYGLGAILFWLLTGQPPVNSDLRGDNLAAAFAQLQDPQRFRHFVVPRDLQKVCRICLEVKPEDRYRTARELAEELDRFLDDIPIVRRGPNAAERVFRTLMRRRLDPAFHAWHPIAFLAAALACFISLWSFLWAEAGHSERAFGWLGGTGLFWGGMGFLIVYVFRRGRTLEKVRELGIGITMNLLACLLMQLVISGEFFPSYERKVNVWAPAAVINSLMLGFMGLYLDSAIFYAAGVVFGI